MSKSVDERVVEMRFNNKQFEEGINDSIKSLENLKKSLKMEDASKGLKSVEESGKKFSLDTVSNALQAVTSKFSILGTVGDQIIRNLTNKFMELEAKAVSVVKSLSVDQVSVGWGKYEEKTNSVQTIMNATGATMGEVEKQLAKLQWYADETSYSFTDMTSNVGKFTNANVPLDKAVNAMMGIANWAAASGAGAQEASRAMYNLSQAMSMDKVTLLDWRSIENANMSTMKFKETVLETAEEMGYLRRMADGTLQTMQGTEVDAAGLRNTLEDGWFTGEVLTATLEKYSNYTNKIYDSKDKYDDLADAMANTSDSGMELGAMAFRSAQEYRTLTKALEATKDQVSSGWMESFEIIFGNLEEAKVLWTKVGNALEEIFASSAKRRNELLRSLKDQGAFKIIFESFGRIKVGFTNLVHSAKTAWKSVFPPSQGQTIMNIIHKFDEFTKRFKVWSMRAQTVSNIQTIIQGIGSAFQIFKKIVSTLLSPLKAFREETTSSGKGLMDLVAGFFALFTKLNESEKFNEFLTGFANILSGAVKIIIQAVTKFIDILKNLKDFLAPVGDFFARVWQGIKSTVQSVIDYFTPASEKVEAASTRMRGAIEKIGGDKNTAKKVQGKVKNLKESFNPLVKIFEVIVGFGKMVKSIIDAVSPLILATFQKITELVNATVEALTRMSKKITFEDILAGGLSAGITKFLWNFADFIKGIKSYVAQIKEVFGSISEGISSFSKSMEKEANAVLIKSIAKAVLMLAVAIFILCKCEPRQIIAAGTAVAVMLAEITGSGNMLSKDKKKTTMDPKQLLKMGTLLKKLATAILILAVALRLIASLDAQQLAAGVAAIGGLMLELTVATKYLSKNVGDKNTSANLVKVGVGLKLVASAIKTLARSVVIIAQLSVEQIVAGVAAIGVMLAELVGFTKAVSGAKNLGKIGFGMIELAAAVAILSLSVAKLGEMPIPVLVQGLLAIGVALVGIAGAMRIMPSDVAKKGAALIMLALGLELLTLVVKQLGSMDLATLVKGLAAIGVAIVGISAAMNLMPKSGVLKDGGAFLMIALAMDLLLPALKVIGNMSWESIAKGVAALGIIVAGIAGATRLMTGNLQAAGSFILIAIALDLLVPALVLLGRMPMAAIGIGLVAIAGSLGLLVAAGYAIAPVSGNLMKLAGAMMLMSISAALFAGATIIMVGALMALAKAGQAAVQTLIASLALILVELPGLLKVLAASVKQAIPSIVSIIGSLISGLLTVIREQIPAIVNTLLDTIIEVLTALAEKAPVIIEKLFQFLVAIFDGLKKYIPVIAEDIMLMLRGIIDAVLVALEGLTVKDVAKAIAGLAALSIVFTELAVVSLLGLATTGMLTRIAKNLNTFIDTIQPFLNKVQQVGPETLAGAEALANTVMTLTKASILDALTGWFRKGDGGGMVKFGEQIAQLGPYIAQYAQSIGTIDGDAVLKSALAAQALAGFANSLPREGGFAQKLAGTTDLVGFVKGLVGLGPALKLYANSVAGLDSGAIESSIAAASIISTYANNLPRHGGWVQALIGDNSLAAFGEEIAAFGPKLQEYATSVTGLPGDVIAASATAAEALATMAHMIPNEGGLLSAIIGDNTLTSFGEELVAFGPLFATYAQSIANVQPDVVEKTSTAAAALFAAANSIPRDGGFLQDIIGHQDLGEFAMGLGAFGNALASYSESVSGNIDIDSIKVSAEAATVIFEAASKMPNQGGVVGWFMGDNKIGDFAEGLKPFGKALKSYGENVDGLNNDDIKASMESVELLFETASKMPNQGGVVGWFMGDNKIGDFAEGLKPFGKALKSFGENVDGLNNDDILVACESMAVLFDTASKMPNQGGVISWFAGDNKLSKMGDELVKFGPKFAKYGRDISGISVAAISASARAMSTMFLALHTMPNQGGIISWIQGDNTLGKIGKDLEVFGPSFARFAFAMTELDGTAWRGMDAAIASLSKLFLALHLMPNQGGIKSWFEGDNTLGKIGKDLVVFSPNYVKFVRDLDGFDEGDIANVTAAFKSLKYLTEALAVMPDQGGWAGWFSGDQSLAKISEGLGDFGEQFKTFATNIKGFEDNQASVEAAFTSLTLLGTALDSFPETEGFMQNLFGEKSSLKEIGEGLGEFSANFVSFANSVKDIEDFAPVESAFNALAVLGTALQSFPLEDGMVQKFFGQKSNLNEIGIGLSEFSTNYVGFANSVSTITDFTSINGAFDSLGTLGAALNKLPSYNGKVQEWIGEKSFTKLSEELPGLGSALATFSARVSFINTEKMESAVDSTVQLVQSMAGLNTDRNKFFELFDGEKSFKNFGVDLAAYGNQLLLFQQSVEDVDPSRISVMTAITSHLVDTVKELEPLNGWDAFWSGKKSLSALGTDLEGLGGSYKSFVDTTEGISFAEMITSIDTIYKFIDLAKATNGIDFGGYWNFSEALGNLSLYGAQTFIDNFKGKYEEATEAGAGFLTSVMTAIETEGTKLTSTITDISNGVVNGLNGPVYKGRIMSAYSATYDIGLDLGQGLINGLNNKSGVLYATATTIATNAVNNIAAAAKVESPSKATYEIGGYLVEGLANGMTDNSGLAESASDALSSEVLLSMQRAIASVMAIMESEGDISPIIRPVVDLSDAERQVGKLDSMFAKSPVASTGLSAAAGLNRTIQNGGSFGGVNSTTNNNSAAITFNIYGGRGMDAQDIANEVQKRLKMDLDRRGYAFR